MRNQIYEVPFSPDSDAENTPISVKLTDRVFQKTIVLYKGIMTILVKLLFLAALLRVALSKAGKRFEKLPGLKVEDRNDEVLHITTDCAPSAKYKCVEECWNRGNCTSVSFSKSQAFCRIHVVSHEDLNFGGSTRNDGDWTTYVKDNWKVIAKFSSHSDTFQGDYSYELWSNPANSLNDGACISGNVMYLSTKCERHFVDHDKDTLLDLLLGLNSGTKVKISLYGNGTETAWVIFDKQPGSNDSWFQPSRIVDSYPWDTHLLKSSAEMSLEPQTQNDNVRFYIVESNPSLQLKSESAHAYWMKLVDKESALCEYGRAVNYPYILYSKGANPTLLSKSGVVRIVKSSRYSLPWSVAQTFCENNLHVPIATYDEVNSARINQSYTCCNRGWMANQVNSYPMAENGGPGCGGPFMSGVGSTGTWDVYCKPDQSLVGVADTMVISINI